MSEQRGVAEYSGQECLEVRGCFDLQDEIGLAAFNMLVEAGFQVSFIPVSGVPPEVWFGGVPYTGLKETRDLVTKIKAGATQD